MADGVLAVALSGDHVLPGGREGILEVAHEDLRPGVEGVDHHLALHRAGDFGPPVVEIGRCGRHPPGPFADADGFADEIGKGSSLERAAASPPGLQQRLTPGAEATLEIGHESESLGRQDPGRVGKRGSDDLERIGGGCGHGITWIGRLPYTQALESGLPDTEQKGWAKRAPGALRFVYRAPAPMSTAMVRHLP